MPASTPIYNFPYPLGTDPVTNGAQDIQDLATAVEGTIGSVVGLVKIVPSSVTGTGASVASDGSVLVVSGGTTFTITDCFNADYEIYEVLVNDLTLSTATGIDFQLRTATTTSTTGYYTGGAFISGIYGQTAFSGASTANGSTYGGRIISGTGGGGGAKITFFNPFLATPTGIMPESFDPRAGGASVIQTAGYHSVAASYTSLVFNSTANFTKCRVSVYGYN
jgi:hypothetical protein